MEYLLALLLTTVLSLAIIAIVIKKQNKSFKKVKYRQSDIYEISRPFLKDRIKQKKQKSQMAKREEGKEVKIVAIDDRAYWVIDNVFYTAELVDNHPNMSTAQPIDTLNMPKEDLDKMLFILDNLDRGNKDERGSTGN